MFSSRSFCRATASLALAATAMARETALELAADLRVKRKDLKARETALELARRDLKSPLLYPQPPAAPTL